MVEGHANATEDYLIEGLSFKLAPGASYITNRRSVTFHPSGSDIYSSSTGTKVIKIRMNGSDWLDPSTCKLMFTLTNKSLNTMTFLSGPHSFFKRLRVLVGGQSCEDIDEYARTCEMFNVLQSSSVRKNDSVEGVLAGETLANDKTRRVGMKLLSGLLNQSKMIPLRVAPIEIELELVSDALDAIYCIGTASWTITDVQLKCDLCTLDNELENSYSKHLLSGQSLPINYGTYISQSQVLGTNGPSFGVNISRAVTRLKSIFMTFEGPINAAKLDTVKSFNNLWHPMALIDGEYNDGQELELQVQIGSKLYPEYPIRSVSESMSQLRKTMGIHQTPFHSVDISPEEYRNRKFIAAIDTEKVLDAGFTGLNTRAGDLMTIKCKPVNSALYGNVSDPTKFHTVLHSDNILEIRDQGVAIFD